MLGLAHLLVWWHNHLKTLCVFLNVCRLQFWQNTLLFMQLYLHLFLCLSLLSTQKNHKLCSSNIWAKTLCYFVLFLTFHLEKYISIHCKNKIIYTLNLFIYFFSSFVFYYFSIIIICKNILCDTKKHNGNSVVFYVWLFVVVLCHFFLGFFYLS